MQEVRKSVTYRSHSLMSASVAPSLPVRNHTHTCALMHLYYSSETYSRKETHTFFQCYKSSENIWYYLKYIFPQNQDNVRHAEQLKCNHIWFVFCFHNSKKICWRFVVAVKLKQLHKDTQHTFTSVGGRMGINIWDSVRKAISIEKCFRFLLTFFIFSKVKFVCTDFHLQRIETFSER